MKANGEPFTNSFDYGLRSRLVLLLVVMLLPFIVFSSFQAYRAYSEMMQAKTAENERDAREVAGNVDELVQSTADLLVAISHSQAATDQDYTALKKWFAGVAADYPYYKNIIFVDLNGNIRAAAQTYLKPDGKIIASVKETAYYRRSIRANGLEYGDYMKSVLSKQPVIHITYPVFSDKGKRLGFVAIAFDLTRLQKRIVTVNIAEGSEVTVFDKNGTVIARTLDPSRWVGQCFGATDFIESAKSGSSTTGPGPDGVVRLMSFNTTSKAPWLVSVCFEEAIVREHALDALFKQVWFVLPLLLVAMIGWLWIGRDVDGLYKTARRLSLADPMTSLGSFVKFNQDTVKDIARAKRSMQSLSLLIIDINEFRRINEASGYQYGNAALKQIATTIQEELRDTDFAYRYGGDEIALILTDTDELDAVEFADKVKSKIEGSTFAAKDGKSTSLTVTIGIAVYPLDASDAQCLAQCAIEALFAAKDAADNGIMTYSETDQPSKAKTG